MKMKKVLLIVPFILLIGACAKEPEEILPPLSNLESSESQPPDSSNSSQDSTPQITYYQAKLDAKNSTLTNDDLAETTNVTISTVSGAATYVLTISSLCYLKNVENNNQEIILKDDCYICSNSSYEVNRLIIDFYGRQGTNFTVYDNKQGTGEGLTYHESTVEPIDGPSGGMVYEYAINGSDWMIKNTNSPRKTGLYSITIIFSK